MEEEGGIEVALPRRWESLALAAVLLLTLGLLALSLSYPMWGDFQPGPGLFPTIAAALAVLCAAGALGGSLLARRDGSVAGASPVWSRLLVYVAIVLLWPASFATLGFAVSSLVALTLLMRLGEGMGWLISFGIAALTVAAGWLLFEWLLGVPMPHGVLPA